MAQKTSWEQARDALARGDYAEARRLVLRLLRREPDNVEYLLFLSAVAQNDRERIQALKQVLRVDPENPEARRGLAFLQGAEPPEPPVHLDLRSQWEKQYLHTLEEAAPARRSWKTYGLGIAVLLGLLLLTLAGRAAWEKIRPRRYGTIGKVTLVPTTPGPTATQTPTPRFTPTPIPLEMLLEATYTPTPRYIQTPHPFEAFRQGLRALNQGDWEKAIFYFQDVLKLEGPTPDVYLYLCRAYRGAGQMDRALEACRKTIQVDPDFGPGYAELARTEIAQWEKRNPGRPLPASRHKRIEDLFRQATVLAPDYGEAYLQWGIFRLRHLQDPKAALEVLKDAAVYFPGSPQVAYWQARAYLQLGELEEAREAIQQALEADITHLPTYLLFAQIALAQEDLKTAAEMLETYRRYRPNDPRGLLVAGELAWAQGQQEDALALWESIEEEQAPPDVLPHLWQRLAEAYIALGQGQKAVDTALKVLKHRGENDPQALLLMGRAWMAADKPGNAYQFFHAVVRRAQNAQDLPLYYTALYWRAKTLAALNERAAARRDWKEILEGPEEYVPEAWKEEARAYLFPATATPSPTPVEEATATETPSSTPTKEAP